MEQHPRVILMEPEMVGGHRRLQLIEYGTSRNLRSNGCSILELIEYLFGYLPIFLSSICLALTLFFCIL